MKNVYFLSDAHLGSRAIAPVSYTHLDVYKRQPRYNSEPTLNHTSFDLGANFPTRIAKVRAVNASVSYTHLNALTIPDKHFFSH